MAKIKHGYSMSKNRKPEYHVWATMLQRCSNPKHEKYKWYGGRGIQVCSRWLQFANFIADMGPRPTGYQIDRIKGDIGYEPANCRWVPRSVQSRNTTQNVLV